MMPDPSERQDDPFRSIQRPLINSSNVQAHRLTFLDALGKATETCRTVAGWAAPPQELRERPDFDRDQFIEATLQSTDQPPERHASDALCRRELAGTGV